MHQPVYPLSSRFNHYCLLLEYIVLNSLSNDYGAFFYKILVISALSRGISINHEHPYD